MDVLALVYNPVPGALLCCSLCNLPMGKGHKPVAEYMLCMQKGLDSILDISRQLRYLDQASYNMLHKVAAMQNNHFMTESS